jgi:hypothetical protein
VKNPWKKLCHHKIHQEKPVQTFLVVFFLFLDGKPAEISFASARGMFEVVCVHRVAWQGSYKYRIARVGSSTMPGGKKRTRKLRGVSKRSTRESRAQFIARLVLLSKEEAAHELALFLRHKDIAPLAEHIGYPSPHLAATYKHIVEESVGPGLKKLSKRGGQTKEASQQQKTGYTLIAGALRPSRPLCFMLQTYEYADDVCGCRWLVESP